MNHLTNKMQQVERDIAKDNRRFNLFALLEREDLANRWDLVIAAPWAKHDEPTLRYIVDALKRHKEYLQAHPARRIEAQVPLPP